MPLELTKGEHFVLADLCKSSPSSSSRVVAAQEDLAKAAIGALLGSVRVTQPWNPQLARWLEKKERDRKRARHTKLADVGLEDFMDWTGILPSEPTEEEEMSTLAAGFAARMRKWVRTSRMSPPPI